MPLLPKHWVAATLAGFLRPSNSAKTYCLGLQKESGAPFPAPRSFFSL